MDSDGKQASLEEPLLIGIGQILLLESLILAQDKRWRRALNMQVVRY